MNGIRYTSLDEVTLRPWRIQGTVYQDLREAKMAAMKLFASLQNDGVVVKKIGGSWTCFWWRRK